MRAARLPAWSSPNFFTTANGNAAHARRCCSRSSGSRKPFTRRWLPHPTGPSPSWFPARAPRWRLCRSGEAAAAEDEVALRAPGPVRVLLEQAEPTDAKLRLIGRERREGTVERVARQVVRDGDVRVVRKADLAMQRAGAHLGFELFTLADPLHERHEHDGRHRPEGRRATQQDVEVLLLHRDVPQMLLDQRQRLGGKVGRWHQGHVRRDAGGVGVAEALTPALQLAVERLGEPDRHPDRATRAATPRLGPLSSHPRAGRKPTASYAWASMSAATLRARAAPAARTWSSASPSSSQRWVRSRYGVTNSVNASATSPFNAP